MAIKRRRTTATVGTDGATGTFSKDLSLGAAYALLLKLEIKGDDTNVATATFLVVDAEGRKIATLATLDAGPDDSTTKATNQTYSTVGRSLSISPKPTDIVTTDGDFGAATEGAATGIVVASPLTISASSATDTDAFQLTAYVLV